MTVPLSTPEDRLTEAGAAERFARLHGADVRFDHRRSRWLLWEGHRWVPDADAAVIRLAIDFARAWQQEAITIPDLGYREAAIKLALRLERRDGLGNMLTLARALKPIANAGDEWDADIWLLGVPNGVIDLSTGERRSGHRNDHITMNTAVAYEPAATCPRWTQFIHEVFDSHQPLIDFVHRAIGYSLTGITSEQVLFLLYGTGANGKGTFTNTLKHVLGDYAWNMPFATIEMRDRASIPNDLAALVNRRFVTASETNDGARLNEARVKTLTGCDPVTARFLHGEFFTFEPRAKFWLSVNHKPIVRDDSFGFWRRLRLIPFSQRFDVNAGLASELRAEAAGILTWCVQAARSWNDHGLNPPAVVVNATREYERDSDPLAAFLEEACELDPVAEVTASDLYNHYSRWADQHGLSDRDGRLKMTGFGIKVSERFQKDRQAGTGRVLYRGIARRSSAV
jgi:putative DNA primase/helicase